MTDTTSTGGPAVTVPAATYTGATAHMVRIRAEHAGDEPGVRLVGLPPEHVWTTRDRLRAALTNSGLTYPAGPLTLAVFPHDLQVGDSGLDLAFALALLAATGQLPTDRVTALACLSELGLDGSLRPVPGLTARARAVAAAAIPDTVVAADDLPAAVPILGGSVRAASSLADLVAALRGGTSVQRPAAWPVAPTLAGADLAQVAAAPPPCTANPVPGDTTEEVR